MAKKKNIEAEVDGVAVAEPVEAVDASDTPLEMFIDHQRRAVTETRKALQELVPKGVREHGDAALKEMVEGYRTLFNAAIDDVVELIDKARIKQADSDDTK